MLGSASERFWYIESELLRMEQPVEIALDVHEARVLISSDEIGCVLTTQWIARSRHSPVLTTLQESGKPTILYGDTLTNGIETGLRSVQFCYTSDPQELEKGSHDTKKQSFSNTQQIFEEPCDHHWQQSRSHEKGSRNLRKSRLSNSRNTHISKIITNSRCSE